MILNEVGYSDLAPLLHYIYHGEVQIHHSQINDFLRTATLLQIRGLAGGDKSEDQALGVPAPSSLVQNSTASSTTTSTTTTTTTKNGNGIEGSPPPLSTPTVSKSESPAPAGTPTPSQEDEDTPSTEAPAVKRPRLLNSVGSSEDSPPSPPNRNQSSPPTSIAPPHLPGLGAGLPPIPPHPVLPLPLSIPSSMSILPPVSSSLGLHRPPSISRSSPLSAAHIFPQTTTTQSEDTSDTCASDRSEDRTRHDHDIDDDHESSLEKMSGLANMATFKGLFYHINF